ncbi:Mu transposase C-terminal domain-containing protein [Paenibacillus farraposensis]|uniref:Mu transposase C-terminal domain-containing protein n=1 Tax=Paenibacillus farraposensis TaxID=2807095 RepID=UPI00361F5EF9
MKPRLLNESKRTEFLFTQVEQPRTIRGSISSGKRPYIEYMGVEYRNELLVKSAHLIGTKVNVHINVDDLRTIRVFLPDGSEFGELIRGITFFFCLSNNLLYFCYSIS